MARFQRELRGDLGAFWQQHAQGELAKVKANLESYRAARRTSSAEEMAEMRAAFGEGTTVVDVLTGEKIRL